MVGFWLNIFVLNIVDIIINSSFSTIITRQQSATVVTRLV